MQKKIKSSKLLINTSGTLAHPISPAWPTCSHIQERRKHCFDGFEHVGKVLSSDFALGRSHEWLCLLSLLILHTNVCEASLNDMRVNSRFAFDNRLQAFLIRYIHKEMRVISGDAFDLCRPRFPNRVTSINSSECSVYLYLFCLRINVLCRASEWKERAGRNVL